MSKKMIVRFLLEEKMVIFPGFVTVKERTAATTPTLIHSEYTLPNLILAKMIPIVEFQLIKWVVRYRAQYKKSANARFIMK